MKKQQKEYMDKTGRGVATLVRDMAVSAGESAVDGRCFRWVYETQIPDELLKERFGHLSQAEI